MSHPDETDAPVRRSSFVRDLGVTVVVFVALVGAVAGWLWIRDAIDERGDRVATAAGVADATPTPTSEPSDLSEPATPTPTQAAPSPSSPLVPPPRWVPVVEVFAPGTQRAVAEQRAMAVTALGFPATAMALDQVDGIDAGTWVLAGTERDSLDEALASCEGRALLRTCQANTLTD